MNERDTSDGETLIAAKTPVSTSPATSEPLDAGSPRPSATAPTPTPASEPTDQEWRPPAKTPPTRAAIAALVAAAIVAILYAWQLPPFANGIEETDNAYVRGRTTIISPQVSGYVTSVPVQDFQEVRLGQALVRIDDQTFRARLEQERADVLTEMSNLDNSVQAQRSRQANTLAQDAEIAGAKAELARAGADMNRLAPLVEKGWATRSQRDQKVAALRQAEAEVHQARAAREIARQELQTVIVGRGGLSATVEAARAQARLAEIDLNRTVIRAPEAGMLSEIGVRVGQYVTAGTQLMFLVPRRSWVIANFKETQTRNMRVGQPATVRIDALGGARLTGRVESLAPAAGSEFAVLRPDNATGNFVKVAQRISVRIQIDQGQLLAARLRPGMSVVARVDTRVH